MTIDQIFLIILPIGLVGIYYYGRQLLKGDNYFFYKNGRSMRTLDITLSGEEDIYNKRINSLTPETLSRLKKWFQVDYAFIPALYITVAILCYFASKAYAGIDWQDFFTLLIVGQGVSLICDIIENGIVLKSLALKKLPVSMSFFNMIIGLKLFFPILGLFVSFATAVLTWFRFLNTFVEPLSALLFVVPPIIVFFIYIILKKKKKTT